MATTKTSSKNAFISLGILPAKNAQGAIISKTKYIVIPERFAKYMGAQYTSETPKGQVVATKRGKRAGRFSSREFAAKMSGAIYEFGYYDGTGTSLSSSPGGRKIKWIPVHVPRGISLKVFLKIFMTKITRKPHFIKTPSGMSTRFNNV
jgi:hypothetical protein